MATTTSKTLKMVFGLGENKTKTLTLKDPKDGLTAANVQTFMGEVVNTSAIKIGSAIADDAKSAKIIETTTTDLF